MKKFLSLMAALAMVVCASTSFAQDAAPVAGAVPAPEAAAVAPCDAVAPCEPVVNACEPVAPCEAVAACDPVCAPACYKACWTPGKRVCGIVKRVANWRPRCCAPCAPLASSSANRCPCGCCSCEPVAPCEPACEVAPCEPVLLAAVCDAPLASRDLLPQKLHRQSLQACQGRQKSSFRRFCKPACVARAPVALRPCEPVALRPCARLLNQFPLDAEFFS